MRILSLILALCGIAAGQVQVHYIATTNNVSLTAATTAATLQQPSSNALPVSFPSSNNGAISPVAATIYCSVACVATLSRSCTTPATATAGTLVSNGQVDPPARVTFWTASNASGCTLMRTINIAAGQEYAVDGSYISLSSGGTTSNLHIAISAITGTANITFFPVEAH